MNQEKKVNKYQNLSIELKKDIVLIARFNTLLASTLKELHPDITDGYIGNLLRISYQEVREMEEKQIDSLIKMIDTQNELISLKELGEKIETN